MNDTSLLTIRAFLAALTQLPAPLPPEIQAQLRAIGGLTIFEQGEALSELVRQDPTLQACYKAARQHLGIPTTQRSKSGLFVPNDAAELHRPNPENNNAYQDDRLLLAEFGNVLEQLEKMPDAIVQERLKTVAQADNSVEAARAIMMPLTY